MSDTVTSRTQKTALTECEAAFKKSNEAGEHPDNAEAFRAFRAGWYARVDSTATPSEGHSGETRGTYIPLTQAEIDELKPAVLKLLNEAGKNYACLDHSDFLNEVDTLFSMAGNALLYGEEIQRLRSAPTVGERIVYMPCSVHQGLSWRMEFDSKAYVPAKQICPICNPPKRAAGG